MAGRALERIQEAWLEEWGHLDAVAIAVKRARAGSFVGKLAEAWLHADGHNKRILEPAWRLLILKYDLDKEG